ncbi:MAG: CPBP family intramembrane metalloprotease [Burkholderiales bacterium]|jgi:membrane protease YdiL (CAAX protease family)|nr:MAG: CPBP family intramembrane metalloprotease [Burkholderiales bacterium]
MDWVLMPGAAVLPALAVCGLFALCGVWFRRSVAAGETLRASTWPAVLLGLLSLAMALHAFPWLPRWQILAPVQLSEGAPPFTLSLSLDKALAGWGLMWWACRRCGSLRDVRRMLPSLLAGACATVFVVMGLAWLSHIVRWDPKWPAQAGVFLLVNLLVTCVAEEAFFRGLLQERLTQLWAMRPRALSCGLPVFLSACLFGLAHLGGGVRYALLATVAGLGYGLVYARTRRIEAAILTHFAVNTAHFLLFTYPRLA